MTIFEQNNITELHNVLKLDKQALFNPTNSLHGPQRQLHRGK